MSPGVRDRMYYIWTPLLNFGLTDGSKLGSMSSSLSELRPIPLCLPLGVNDRQTGIFLSAIDYFSVNQF